jgi:hypothetical protein
MMMDDDRFWHVKDTPASHVGTQAVINIFDVQEVPFVRHLMADHQGRTQQPVNLLDQAVIQIGQQVLPVKSWVAQEYAQRRAANQH